jgi:hypothetical protein
VITRTIATQVQALIATEDEDEPSTQDGKGLSLSEIMEKWYQAPADIEQSAIELFEGVEELEDEEPDQALVSEYTYIIVTNSAFEWLIKTVVKEASLFWSKSDPKVMLDEVRAKVLRRLPTGTISKKKQPGIHEMTISLPWRIRKLSGTKGQIHLKRYPDAIGDSVILTCSSSDGAQLSTTRQYIEKTWSVEGLELLNKVLDQLEYNEPKFGKFAARSFDRYLIWTVVLPDGTEIKATIENCVLHLTCRGLAYSIAQVAEQFTWLAAALQLPERIHSSPYIVECTPYLADDGGVDVSVSLSYEDSHASHWYFLETWLSHHGLATITAVRGYPSIRRPPGFLGLEMPFSIISNTFKYLNPHCERPQFTNGRIDFGDRLGVLHLVVQSAGVILWHLAQGARDCLCSDDDCLGSYSRITSETFLDNFAMYRHIVGNCVTLNTAPREVLPGAEPGFSTGKGTPGLSSPKCPSPKNSRSISPASTETSLDSDMLSVTEYIDIFSAENDFDPDGTLRPVLDKVIQWLISNYRIEISIPNGVLKPSNVASSRASGTSTQESSSGGTDTSQPLSNKSGITTWASSLTSGTKRGQEADDDDDNDENTSKPPHKSRKLDGVLQPCEIFACPFWKKDGTLNSRCFHITLPTIKRVKQHLTRNHTPEFYCQRCLKILDKATFDRHVTRGDNDCILPQPGTLLQGIT